MMKKLLFILMISFMIVSCGQKSEPSKAKFKIFSGNLTNPQATFLGGLLIMGRSVDGTQSFTMAYQSGLELELKKGSWEFATIGWIGTKPMEGNQQCSYQAAEISADVFTVNFNMTRQGCLNLSTSEGNRFTDPIFYNFINGTYNGFKKLQVKTCADITSCSTQTLPSSYRVEIPTLLKGISSNIGSGSLISSCISGMAASNITPPHGGANGFIGMKITIFSSVLAKFNNPYSVAVDSIGNIYVADTANYVIRKIDPNGIVTTLAGMAGVTGSLDGVGSMARFTTPKGIAVDSSGNIYVADTVNHLIRKITSNGVVSTLAGTAGVAGSADGIGTAAMFSEPSGIAVDSSGNVYVADTMNQTIRKITSAGVVTTLAGTVGVSGSVEGVGATATFNVPISVAVDFLGNVYVADAGNYTIRKITPSGVVSTLAGMTGSYGSVDGTGSTAMFGSPQGVTIDSVGNIYVADRDNQTVRKITSSGVVTTLAGIAGSIGSVDATGSAAMFNYLQGVSVDSSGNVYVSDAGNQAIRKVTPAGVVTTVAGTVLINGSNDGAGKAVACGGVPKSYFFNHGFGEVLNRTYIDNGVSVNRRGALSLDVNSVDAALALAPMNFRGDYSINNIVPGLIGINDLYIYNGAGPMTVLPYAPVGNYLYHNGTTWVSFPETDSVKLLLQD